MTVVKFVNHRQDLASENHLEKHIKTNRLLMEYNIKIYIYIYIELIISFYLKFYIRHSKSEQ